MRITISCPHCQRASQVETEHRGRRLKCPYPDCRLPFIVGEDDIAVPYEEPRAPAEEQPQVVDWQASDAPSGGGDGGGAWEPPPVRRTASETEPATELADQEGPVEDIAAQEPVQEVVAEEVVVDQGEEVVEVVEEAVEEVVVTDADVVDADAGEPVEEIAYEAGDVVAEESYQTESQPVDYLYAPVKPRKKTGPIILVGSVVLLVVCGIVLALIFKALAAREGQLAERYQKEFASRNFDGAMRGFRDLIDKYPDSDRKSEYEFLADLCEVLSATQGSRIDSKRADALLSAFQKRHAKNRLYKEHLPELWEAMAAQALAAAAEAERTADSTWLELAQASVERAKQVGFNLRDQNAVEAKNQELDSRLQAAREKVATAKAKKTLVAELQDMLKAEVPGTAESAQELAAVAIQDHPALANDAEVKSLLDRFRELEPEWVDYHEENKPLPVGPPPSWKQGTNLVVCPLLQGSPPTEAANDRVVFALDRGVVYALSEATGEFRWALRVGIDSQTPPVFLPTGPRQPQVALILSAETNLLLAVRGDTGQILWHYDVGSACPAGPILVGRPARVYLPTADGMVHVIEPFGASARLAGTFEIGLPLTVPGALDPVTNRLYLPADKKRIFVLDLARHECIDVLYTNHAVGGLRSAPIVARSYLVIAEAANLGRMKVRAFDLSQGGEPRLAGEFSVKGWSWYRPYFDGDTIGFVTDRGYMALFGLKRGTADRVLFRLTPDDLPTGVQRETGASDQAMVGRGQVCHVELNRWWILVGGQLEQRVFDLYRQTLFTPTDSQPLPLGIPLQESQLLTDGRRMMLVTQAVDQSVGLDRTMATVVDLRTGKVVWQRQLGLAVAQEPIAVGDRWYWIDKVGGVWVADRRQIELDKAKAWQAGGDWLANGSDQRAVPGLAVTADGSRVVAYVCTPRSEKIVCRTWTDGQKPTEAEYPLDTVPAGTAVATSDSLLVPCRDGTIREFPFQFARKLPEPLTWREARAGSRAVGHLVLVTPTQLLVTDGLNRLQRWDRTEGKVWRKTTGAFVELTARITTPVVLIQRDGQEQWVCLGDDSGAVSLFDADSLAYVRQWRLSGRITEGPFIRGNRIGCVLDRRVLVWLDPENDLPLWQYELPDADAGGIDTTIVGQPRLVGNRVLITRLDGRFVWLNAETGSPLGEYRLPCQAIPAAAAVPFGPNRAFVPLSDGTFHIVPLGAE